MKTFKKSLSLIMAVLMVLSCWVWVAPTEAQAGAEEGQYYFKWVIGNVSEAGNSGNWAGNQLTIYYTKVDGTTGNKVVNLTKSNYSSTGANKVIWEGWIDGFPTSAGWYMEMEWKAAASVYLNARDCTYYVGSSSSNMTAVSNTDSFKWQNDAIGQGTKEGTITLSAQADKYPQIATFKDKPITSATVELPSIKADLEDKKVFSSNFAIKCYDQYGVRITASTEFGIKTINNASADFDYNFNKDISGLWYENGNVWYNRDLQALVPNKSGTSYYLFCHYSDTRFGEKRELLSTITINYPKYTVSVDPDGSVLIPVYGEDPIKLQPDMDMSNGKPQSNKWSYTGVYQTSAATFPKGTASKEGYIFKGFWTKPQPVSTTTKTEAADYNSLEAEFATPVSSEDFVNVYGGKKEGEEGYTPYVTKDGKTYYDAGKLWSSDTGKMAVEDVDYYGWWLAEDITVNFYDIDGAYLGTNTTKRNKIENTDWYPEPKNGYVSGAFTYQGFAGQWRDITGALVTEGSHQFSGKSKTLTLTPVYETKTYKDTYNIKFISPLTGAPIDPTPNNNVGSGDYAYRHLLEGANIAPAQNVPIDIAYGYDYSYEFSGWSSQVPANGARYHVVLKDDTSFAENTDWIVRDDVTYYAVFRATVKEYVIAFKYTDSTGEEKTDIKYVAYGASIDTPDEVNRTYAKDGKGYNLLSWRSDYIAENLDVDGVIVLNEENVGITEENLKGKVPEFPVLFEAVYDKGTPMPYTITFKYKNAKGVDKTFTADVNHGSKITADIVAELAIVPAEYDDGSALYTFADKWIVTDGASDKAEYATDELTTFGPVSHVTFEAVYGEGVPFYTVTYIDGDKTFTERVLKDSNLPAWFVNDSEYIPTKADAETGEYIFAGWFDEKQTDKDFEETNGTKYTAESSVTGDLVLYPQFTFKAFTYNIKFLNWDGTVLAEGDFEAGESFEETLEAAENAAQKVADIEYYYTFIGWDNNPGNCICGGKELVFTAQYKPGYITYKAKWYADEASMKNADPEFESVGADGLLAVTSHIYGAAVYAPSVKLNIPQGEVFDGWYYKDGTEEKAYHRGMTITSSMSFYARTKVPEAEAGFTVTTVINGETADYRIPVEEGKVPTAEVIGRPLDGYVDENNHNKFDGWYTTEDYAEDTEFDITAEVTEDIKVYAKFTVSAHVMDQRELLAAPTYYEAGSEYVWCACNKEATIAKDDNGEYVATEIPVLQDTTAPTGTIYLGGQSWSSTGTPAYTTDNDPISIRVNDKADVIIAANDAGIGVKIIRAFAFPANTVLTAENYGAAQKIAEDVFTDYTQKINNNANYVVKLGDFNVAALNADGTPITDSEGNVEYTSLKDGEAYIIYYYVNDKATEANGAPATGNQLNRLVRTAKFIYDKSAPEIEIVGDSNAATTTKTITYCGQAIIENIEDGATVTVNGKAVELTGENGALTYTIAEAGNYVITITDEAGNSKSAKIKVTDGHDEVKISKDVTCTTDGYEKITCAVCNKEIKNEVTTHEGHKYGEEVTIAATCAKDGYTYKTCSVCGDVETTSTTPKLDHVDQGRTEVVTKKATCLVAGSKTIYCAACNTALKTEEIAIDENGHAFGAKKTLKATCDTDGEVYRQCKYCYTTDHMETLPKLEHKDTGRYTVVLTPATCYAEGEKATYCKVCDEQIGEKESIDKIDHTLKLVKYEGEANNLVATFKDGYMRYECQVANCLYKSEPTAIKVTVNYTVTFEGVENAFTKTEGETITMDEVYAKDESGNYIYPSKASDEYKNYTFAGWKGEDGKIVNLPIKVKKNDTYVAAYTETKRTYTHTFKIEGEDKANFAVIIGTYEDANKKPSYVPTKAATATERYEFKYWATTAGVEVTDFTMTKDATFVAKFDTIETKFRALFYNEGNDLIWYTSVTSSDIVKYGNFKEGALVVPTKEADDNYHYTFAGWEYVGNDELVALGGNITSGITSDIRIFAKYTKAEHNFVTVEDENKTWAATCTEEGQTTKACSVCDEEKVTVEPKIAHTYVEQTDGTLKCACGEIKEVDAKEVTLTFKHGDNLVTNVTVAEGKTYEITAADKAATAEFNYTFEKWVDEDGNLVSTEAELKVTATDKNATYEAKYTETKRSYSVIYVTSDYKTLQSFSTEFEYGSAIPAYTNATPTQKRDANKHYKFSGWSVDVVNGKVTGDMMIVARFEGTPHNLNNTVTEKATCTTPSTTYKACDGDGCDYKQAVGSTGDTLPHEIKEGTYYEKPAGLEAGERSFTCANCGQKITEKIPANKEEITIIIYDNSGKLATLGTAHVTLYEIVDGTEVFFKGPRDTDDKGVVKFEVGKGKKWKAAITGDGIEGGYGGEVKAGVNTFGKAAEEEVKPEEPSCSCTCHKDTFWGIIYRFFQKLVMWLTGNPKCCGDPDARIWG